VTQTGPSRYRTLSSDLRALGPFFAVETHVRGELKPPPWQPMTALIGANGALPARVDAVRAALAQRAGRRPADVQIRVAASVTHFGLIARLLAPAIGAIALGHPEASLSLDHLWWQNTLGGPYPLSITPRPTTEVPEAAPAVEAITAAIAERYAVSHRVLCGNMGSAANSAAQLISSAQADLTIAAHAAADAILTDPRIDDGALRAGPLFRRRSCCLIYRIANDRAHICGDCVLGSELGVAYD
jgi:hypothetical protein